MYTRLFLFAILVLLSSCHRSCTPPELMRLQHAEFEKEWIDENTCWTTEPLTLAEIIEMAIEHNLDLRVKEFEILSAREKACSTMAEMLPNLIANFTKTSRNKNTASFSESLQPNIPPAPLSISLQSQIETKGLNLSWSLLDFGVAYFQSCQAKNRIKLKEYEYCRAEQKIILDVVKAYWRVVATEIWIEKATDLVIRTKKYRERMMKQIEMKWISDLTALEASKRILDIEKDLIVFNREHDTAKMELVQLMGRNPCIDFQLVVPEFTLDELNLADCEELENVALQNRPELYGKDVEELITREYVWEALVRMVPNIRGWGIDNFNSNRFLLYNYWAEAGLEIAWNLLKVPAAWWEQQFGRSEGGRVRAERLAVAAGIMAQVKLSELLIEDYTKEYKVFKEDYEIKTRLFEAAKKRKKTGEFTEVQVVIYEADMLLAYLETLRTYAGLQGAIESLNNAIGIPLYYGNNGILNNECDHEDESI